MYVLVGKNDDLVKHVFYGPLSMFLRGLKLLYDVYREDDDTVVSVGDTCTVNQDGSRSYS